MSDKTPADKAKATKAKNKRAAGVIREELEKEKRKSGKARAELKAYKDLIKSGWSPKEK